jgi:uncharacterized membrane protein
MAKYIIRTLIIILVAAGIAGGLYAFSQTDAAAAMVPERGEHRDEQRDGPPKGFYTGEEEGEGLHRRGERYATEHGEGNGFGDTERNRDRDPSFSLEDLGAGILKHTLLILVVVLIVIGIQKLAGMVQSKPQPPASPTPPSP